MSCLTRIKNREEFVELSNKLHGLLDIKRGIKSEVHDKYIIGVCSSTGCRASESQSIYDELVNEVKAHGLEG